MARQGLPPQVDLLDTPAPINTTSEGNLTKSAVNQLNSILGGLILKINGFISFGDGESGKWAGNLRARWIPTVAPNPANTEWAIIHDLGRVPVGFILVAADRAVRIYDSRRGSWTEQVAYLMADTADASIVLLGV